MSLKYFRKTTLGERFTVPCNAVHRCSQRIDPEDHQRFSISKVCHDIPSPESPALAEDRYGLEIPAELCGVTITSRGKDLSMAPIHWQPECRLHLLPWPIAPLSTALGRGILGRCPACGQAHLFAGFLRIVRDCASWRAPLGAARAHDAPPYFVILITGHIVIPAMLLAKKFDNATNSQLTAIFVPLTLVLAVGLPRPVKGGVLAALLSMELLDGTAGLE
jgi:uncharacterized protein (DUF983 family)